MNRTSAQTQMIIVIALIVVFAAAVTVLVIVPTFSESAALDDEIAQAQTDLQSAKVLLQRRQAAKAASAANQVELMELANRVPDSPQLPTVIIQLQDAANASGLELAQISPQSVEPGEELASPTAGSAFSKVPITVVLQGSWADIIEFTRKLDAMERGIRVTATNFINVPEEEDEDRYVEANLTLEVYVMAEAGGSSAPASAQPAPPTGTTGTE
jgi:Tfp pilus assembly protein PilO